MSHFGTSSLIPRGTSIQCLKKGHQGCFCPEPGGGKQPGPPPPLQPREGPQWDGQPGHCEQAHQEDPDEEGEEDHEERGGGEAGHTLPQEEVLASELWGGCQSRMVCAKVTQLGSGLEKWNYWSDFELWGDFLKNGKIYSCEFNEFGTRSLTVQCLCWTCLFDKFVAGIQGTVVESIYTKHI